MATLTSSTAGSDAGGSKTNPKQSEVKNETEQNTEFEIGQKCLCMWDDGAMRPYLISTA